MPDEPQVDQSGRSEISELDMPLEFKEPGFMNEAGTSKIETAARVLALIGGSGLLAGGCIATIGANPAINNVQVTKFGVDICGPSTIIGFIGILMLRAIKKGDNNLKANLPPSATKDDNDKIII